ncbi:MAG: transposase [Pseudomonadota bacterium]
MKKPQFDEDLVVEILAETENGRPVAELADAHGVSDVTIYKWRRRYAGLDSEGIRALRSLKEENQALRRALDAAERDNRVLKDLLAKKP